MTERRARTVLTVDEVSAFEDAQPDPAGGRPELAAEFLAARHARDDAERRIERAVLTARREGVPWSAIGVLLGTTGQAAHQRYRRLEAAQQR
ncbi:MAG: hypothetical protein KDA97_02800 [Acidimicrobiales bacterium]|nr:hypothetical protein [Acidimicrobiales bacterium]